MRGVWVCSGSTTEARLQCSVCRRTCLTLPLCCSADWQGRRQAAEAGRPTSRLLSLLLPPLRHLVRQQQVQGGTGGLPELGQCVC